MLRRVILGVVLVLFTTQLRATESSNHDRVVMVLDELHQAAAQADGQKYFSLFAEGAVYIGTDASETWTIDEFRAFAEPYFSQGKGWLYTPINRQIRFSQTDNTAWFVEVLSNEKYGTSRGTGVLEKREGRWKIVQYHLTFPIPNELAVKFTSEIKEFEASKK